MNILIAILFLAGAGFTLRHFYSAPKSSSVIETENIFTLPLKKYLASNEKPQRIEVVNLTRRYASQIEQIKKMKVAQDAGASFYVSIQFFTDENDELAPLVAQVRFIDLKSGNILKEESLNLQ